MAYQAHHQAIIPCCRRYSRRLRAIRDLTRMVEHLETQESEWLETTVAARNKMLLKKWRAQVDVSEPLWNLPTSSVHNMMYNTEKRFCLIVILFFH